jgi:molybdate transport system substrate-binding protein
MVQEVSSSMTGTATTRLGYLAVAAALLAGGCSGADDDTVLILAAASLTDAFTSMAVEFEAANPGIKVELSFAGSNSLSVQVEQGAPGDAVALADVVSINALESAGLVDLPITFASNSLALAVPAGNPGDVMSINDLADPGLLVGVCAPSVPCGAYAELVLAAAGVSPSLDTEEPDVRSLVGKLATGELDVGLVYATDVRAFGDDLEVIALPASIDVRAEYSIGLLDEAPNRAIGQHFIEFVTSARGQEILQTAGFGPA